MPNFLMQLSSEKKKKLKELDEKLKDAFRKNKNQT